MSQEDTCGVRVAAPCSSVERGISDNRVDGRRGIVDDVGRRAELNQPLDHAAARISGGADDQCAPPVSWFETVRIERQVSPDVVLALEDDRCGQRDTGAAVDERLRERQLAGQHA